MIREEEALDILYDNLNYVTEIIADKTMKKGKELQVIKLKEALDMAIKSLEQIKALSKELREVRESITDEKVLIGYNMAIAICNKYLGKESK